MEKKTYSIELANKISKGRAVGNEWVVTKRPIGQTTILARFDTKEEAEQYVSDLDAKTSLRVELLAEFLEDVL